MIYIHIAKDFTDAPGARRIVEGPFSGEEFRKKFLELPIRTGADVQICLDGLAGIPPSFIEGAFVDLIHKFGSKAGKQLSFVCNDYPEGLEDVLAYVNEAEKEVREHEGWLNLARTEQNLNISEK